MAFMAVAMTVIGVGVLVMIAYLVVAQVRSVMPTGAANSSIANITTAMDGAQTTVFAGLGLLSVGVIVVAAFGLISIFK